MASRDETRRARGLWDSVGWIVWMAGAVLVVQTLAFKTFDIPSGSMIPTLQIGDRVVVSKFAYGYSRYSIPFSPPLFAGRLFAAAPQRGDIVVFRSPADGSTDFIKRIVALPGERVQMVGGRLTINGVTAPRESVAPVMTSDESGHDAPAVAWRETLPNGVRHVIAEIDGDAGALDDTPPLVVPDGHYFVLGDNRDNSSDSRVPRNAGGIGFVPFDHLVGRAELVLYSFAGGEPLWKFWLWPQTWRSGRAFTRLR